MREKLGNRLCIISFIGMIMNGVYATATSLIVPLLHDAYGFDYNVSGLLLSSLNIGNMVASFLAGMLAVSFGRKRTAMALTLGSFIGYSLLYGVKLIPLLLAGMFLIGISKGTVYNMGNILVSENAPNETRGINTLHGCFAIGSLCCPIILMLLGVKGSCIFMALFCLLLPVLYAISGMSTDAGKRKKEIILNEKEVKRNEIPEFLKNPAFWLGTGIVFFEMSTENAVSGWLVAYLKDSGLMPQSMSQIMLSFTWAVILAGRMFVAFGPWHPKPQHLILLMSIFSGISFVALLGSRSTILIIIALGAYGFCMAGVQPTAIALAGERLHHDPVAMSVLLPLGCLGGVVMPAVTGFVANAAGIYGGMAAIGVTVTCMILFAIMNYRYER
ncbi:MAG: MFS transporter [Lachnospiraceae bacterium]|nr:MFS transporter [Lachnospiraceae bacterium]